MYSNSPIAPENKWPPTPSKEYINLAVVDSHNTPRDKYIGHTLQGNLKQVLKGRKHVSLEQILECNECQGKLVLVEGAPGIGKSTLAWELCRKWDTIPCMKRYNLVVLLRLREKEVQNITSVNQLSCCYESKDKQLLIDDVLDCQGSGILFILDGFDELPKVLQKEGFLLNLIGGRVLPRSTVLVMSRPSATAQLLTSCRPRIQRHIEILGFSQKSIEAYASSVLSSEPEKLVKFKAFVSASKNPAINSLMYIPLNAAIIVEIYRNCKSDTFLPHTLTELYTELCLTILTRYLNITNSQIVIKVFRDLPRTLYESFLALCQVAFDGIKSEEIIFHTLPPDMITFGFLDAVPAFYGRGGVSYNFLHLTLQEFFAAYHISHLGDNGLKVFNMYGKYERWDTVWRFVAGLTSADYIFRAHGNNVFYDSYDAGEVGVSAFAIQCLFEMQNMKYLDIFKETSQTMVFEGMLSPPLDLFALGYCIAHSPIGLCWNVKLISEPLMPLTCGLQSNVPGTGVITHLRLAGRVVLDTLHGDLKWYPLQGVKKVQLDMCRLKPPDWICLSKLIPLVPYLKELSVIECHVDEVCLLMLLRQLSHSSVTSLGISASDFFGPSTISFPHAHLLALRNLIDPMFGKLKRLKVITNENSFRYGSDRLASLVSSHSSLETLVISGEDLSPYVKCLKGNVNLTTLCLDGVPHGMVEIVKHNKTLLYLELQWHAYNFMTSLRMLAEALRGNNTLRGVKLLLGRRMSVSEYVKTYVGPHSQCQLEELAVDPRIVWSF